MRIDRHRKSKCPTPLYNNLFHGAHCYVETAPSADILLFFPSRFCPQKIVWPKYTPIPVTRIIEKYATSYNELAKEFEAHNWAAVRKAHTVAEFEKVSRPLCIIAIYIYSDTDAVTFLGL